MSNSQTKVAGAIRSRGAAAVARELGTSREAVLSYALGVARDGTSALIEARLDRLPSEPPPAPPPSEVAA